MTDAVKSERYTFVAPAGFGTKIRELMVMEGFATESATIRWAVVEMYKKQFGTRRTAVVKNLARSICEALQGEVDEKKQVCTFKRYQIVGKYVEEQEVTLPLAYLNDEMIETQYDPSKAKVDEILSKKKKK